VVRYAPKGLDADSRLRWHGWTVTQLGCWDCGGTRNRFGYGVITFGGKLRRVHRLAYETWVGPIPEGQVVRHKCDNPPCINPEHLETGTHQDNMDDKMERGRYTCNSGETHQNAKLTQQDVADIRKEHERGVLTQRMLADVYGVSCSTISLIVNKRSRKDG